MYQSRSECKHEELKVGKNANTVFCTECGKNWHDDFVISKPNITIMEYRNATKCPNCWGNDDGKLYPSALGHNQEKKCTWCGQFRNI